MNIPMEKLAQYKHVKFLIKSEKQAMLAYRYLMKKLLAEIKKSLKTERLTKSELPSGWSNETRIVVDLESLMSPVMQKYFLALRWVLLGDYAGKEAAAAAKETGIKGRIAPGLLASAYLQSLDANNQHLEDVGGVQKELSKALLKGTLDEINKRSNRYIDQSLLQLKLNLIDAVEKVMKATSISNAIEVHEALHDSDEPEDALDEALSEITSKMPKSKIDKELDMAIEAHEKNWKTMTATDIAMSSSVGAHQAMLEIYGADNENVKVAIMTLEDERVCNFCEMISKYDGEFILYDMGDLQPSGFNFRRKRIDWKACVGMQHPFCRCQTIYIPPKFKILKNGTLAPK